MVCPEFSCLILSKYLPDHHDNSKEPFPVLFMSGLADSHRLTSSISFYKSLLGIKSVQAISESELHLEYDVSPSAPATRGASKQPISDSVILMLAFDPITKRLTNAEVSDSGVETGNKL